MEYDLITQCKVNKKLGDISYACYIYVLWHHNSHVFA